LLPSRPPGGWCDHASLNHSYPFCWSERHAAHLPGCALLVCQGLTTVITVIYITTINALVLDDAALVMSACCVLQLRLHRNMHGCYC